MTWGGKGTQEDPGFWPPAGLRLPARDPLTLPSGLRHGVLRAKQHLCPSPSFHPVKGPFLALAKSPDLIARSWIQMLALLLFGSGSLGKLYNLFVPQFSCL